MGPLLSNPHPSPLPSQGEGVDLANHRFFSLFCWARSSSLKATADLVGILGVELDQGERCLTLRQAQGRHVEKINATVSGRNTLRWRRRCSKLVIDAGHFREPINSPLDGFRPLATCTSPIGEVPSGETPRSALYLGSNHDGTPSG